MHIDYNAHMPQFKESLFSVDIDAFVTLVGLDKEVLHTKRMPEIYCACNA